MYTCDFWEYGTQLFLMQIIIFLKLQQTENSYRCRMNDIGGEKQRNVERKFCCTVVASCSDYCSNWHTDHFLLYGSRNCYLFTHTTSRECHWITVIVLSLIFRIIKVEYIQDGASFLIGVLTLFFIPATVGVIDYPELMSITGLLIILAVIASTLISIYVTGLLTQLIEKKELKKKEETESIVEEGKGELTVD